MPSRNPSLARIAAPLSRLLPPLRTPAPALASLALALTMGLARPAAAFTFNRNAAHVHWKVAETEHFRFNYPVELEPAAEYIAGIAESVAGEKLKRYNINLPNKVEFIVREDIFSNGWANSFQNVMTVWVSDWEIPTRSTHDWLRDVVTHEFSHLVSIQSSSKLPSPIQGLVLGYQDYFNEPVQSNFASILPFTSQPNWFAEGTAQYESELAGFDAWDSHRDMMLRTAVLENQLIGYDRMGTFTGTSLQYEQGPYTQGFALVKYIAARYGDAAMIRLWAENSRMHRQTLSGSMERVLGKDGHEVWEEWKNAATATYSEQVKGLGTLVAGRKLSSKGFYNYYPRWDSKGENIFLVSNRGRDDFRGALMRYSLADSIKKEEDRFKVVAAGVRSPFDMAADDSTVIYNSARETDKNGMHKLDIWQARPEAKQPLLGLGKDSTLKRYTKDLNAVMPSFDKAGKRAVFVRNHLTNFYLCTAPVPEEKNPKTGLVELDPEEVKTLWPADSALEGRFGFNIYSPRFSPDGKSILFSYYDGTSRNVGLIGDDGKNFRPVLTGSHDERDPEWAPDGKAFYFSSDSTGIYNIYRCNLAPGADGALQAAGPVEALTNVSGGAFAPAVDPSGKRLAYSGYDKDGFSLYLLPEIKALAPRDGGVKAARVLPVKVEAIDFGSKSEEYPAIPNRYLLNPIIFGEEMSSLTRAARQGELRWLAGFNGILNDPVLKNELFGALLLEVGNGVDYFGANDEILSPDKESQFFLAYSNHSFPVSIGASFSRGNLRTSDTIKNKDFDGKAVTETQNFAVTFRNVEGSLAYDLFDADAVGEDEKSTFVRMAGGYSWNDFNFYDLPFGFEYYNNLYLASQLNYYGPTYSDKEIIAPQGLAAVLAYTYNKSGLMRQGSFTETFDFSGGYPAVRYRKYDIHDLDAGATYGTGLFWSKNGSLVASAFAGSVLNWKFTNRDTSQDTLDAFFSKGLFLRGYPYLRDAENLAFQGENVLKLSADLNQPLIPDIYRGWWIFFVEDLYADLFWEAGRAWNGSLLNGFDVGADAWTPSKRPDGWYQTVGWSLKLNTMIYHNYPFLAYFEAATALSGIPDGKGGQEKLEEIRIPFGRDGSINTFATRISFGVSFGLYNGLLGSGASGGRATQTPWRKNPFAAR